ncbi:cyclase family protein, partial [Candidatus Pacearchaeota archaeon]|nr:cyclase family protein [Candidatus Pacearchaeota archaeon]
RINKGEIILLMYGWDKKWKIKSKQNPQNGLSKFYSKFPGLSEETANYLGSLGVKMVGTDAPTIDAYMNFQKAMTSGLVEPAHKALLINHEVIVMECLKNLDKLPPKGAYLFAPPLSIHHGSGAPVRAVALAPKD